MSRIAVKEEVLLWAVGRAGLTINRLQSKFPHITQWVAGEAQPTIKQLENLAKKTHTPFGFFFLPTPPAEDLPIPYFRSQGREGTYHLSPGLVETVHAMERRQAWMRDFIIEQGQKRLEFVKSATTSNKATFVANRIREALKLEDMWASRERTWEDALRTLREAMEAAGIFVVVNSIVGNNTHWQLDVDEFRGFALVDEYAPLVFVNGSDGKAAQMFTLAHELAHVFIGSSAAFDLRELQPSSDPVELVCNKIAAEFLVPEQLLKDVWPSINTTAEPYQELARRYKVSPIVAARRALDLRLIQRKAFLTFYENYRADERRAAVLNKRKKKKIPFNLLQQLRVGKRFASAVARAASEGKMTYTEAYRLTGLYGNSFDRFVASLNRAESGR